MTDRLIRSQSRDRLIRSDARSRFIRGARGAGGVPARQGLSVALSGGPFSPGAIVDVALIEDPETIAGLTFFSRSGVAGAAIFGVLVNDVPAASITVAPGSLPLKQTFALGSPFDLATDDVLTLHLPADAQLADFILAFRS
jgi:hypothetical protein